MSSKTAGQPRSPFCYRRSLGRGRQNIRKFVVRASHLDDLLELGTLTSQAARLLEGAVAAGLNILVSGGTQAGKTTLDNCAIVHAS
jgi:Flp pilus assembly CpaF family ATPase